MDAVARPESFAEITRQLASNQPDRIALSFEGRETTYAELETHTNQVANALVAAGVKKGDRIAYLGKNSDSYFEVFLGAGKMGGTTTPINWRLAWQGEERLVIAELGGTLTFTPAEGTGISLGKLSEFPVTVGLRRGGERMRPDCKRPRRSLKNLLQEAAIPPWERETLPLIFSGERLAGVPGLGVDCDFQAAGGEPSLIADWRPGRAPA